MRSVDSVASTNLQASVPTSANTGASRMPSDQVRWSRSRHLDGDREGISQPPWQAPFSLGERFQLEHSRIDTSAVSLVSMGETPWT